MRANDRKRLVFAGLIVASALMILALVPSAGRAQTFDTKAPNAILIDFDTGAVLFEKSPDEPIVPASMAKLMTIEYVFHQLKDGSLTLDETFRISEHAWRTGGAPSGGSAMFAEIKSDVPVRSLLRGLIVQSGNDAAIAIAEGIAGSESAFADALNRRAPELGLTGSVFRNASGLYDPEQVMTVRDLARIARFIIAEYPEYYPIFAEPEFTWNGITQRNRNPLLGEGGVDGLKTGFIKEAGYGITVSAIRGTQRLILVVAGLGSERERSTEATRLLDWGFRSFEQVTAFEAGEVVADLSVYGGETGAIAVAAKQPVRILVDKGARDALRARVVYQGPLMAPVAEGVEVATFTVWRGDKIIQETPLFTVEAVDRGPLSRRALDALFELAFGWL